MRGLRAVRQILLHLDILLEDSGFAEVPVEAYFATQLKWKKEMKQSFEKMKQEEMKKRRTDQDLLQQREEELAHARDIRQLYESRLETVSTLLVELRERERDTTDRRSDKMKRRQRARALLGGSRGYAKGTRRRSKDGVRRRSSDPLTPQRSSVVKKFSVGSVGSPGLSPLGLSTMSARRDSSRRSVSGQSSAVLSSQPPVFPRAATLGGGCPQVGTPLGYPPRYKSKDSIPPSYRTDGAPFKAKNAANDVSEPVDPPAGLHEPSEGWFPPTDDSVKTPKKKSIGVTAQTSTV